MINFKEKGSHMSKCLTYLWLKYLKVYLCVCASACLSPYALHVYRGPWRPEESFTVADSGVTVIVICHVSTGNRAQFLCRSSKDS